MQTSQRTSPFVGGLAVLLSLLLLLGVPGRVEAQGLQVGCTEAYDPNRVSGNSKADKVRVARVHSAVKTSPLAAATFRALNQDIQAGQTSPNEAWTLSACTDYGQGTARGVSNWLGTFEVTAGNKLQGRGYRLQIDSGNCFQYVATESFRIRGRKEDGHLILELSDYQETGHKTDLAKGMSCMVQGPVELGKLLVDVAKRIDRTEFRIPIGSGFGVTPGRSDIVYQVTRLNR